MHNTINIIELKLLETRYTQNKTFNGENQFKYQFNLILQHFAQIYAHINPSIYLYIYISYK